MVRAPAPVRSSLSHHKPLTYAFSHALQADDELPKPEEIEVEFQDLCTHAPDGRIKTLHPARVIPPFHIAISLLTLLHPLFSRPSTHRPPR